jgi:hypothetical protein
MFTPLMTKVTRAQPEPGVNFGMVLVAVGLKENLGGIVRTGEIDGADVPAPSLGTT